ncbi:guanine nucleotide-binding protein subunit alpha-11-like [Protopterus annectens]|uniref:guanine nucleotide-binding protein subunit alpha-11-like n=1 Tax=Protopterus annectens TaxID=7888 RepID=UPI001CF9CE99|nr:guanine nucleotide-binding protein subunit alpha-11-like [Protopterus annectens]
MTQKYYCCYCCIGCNCFLSDEEKLAIKIDKEISKILQDQKKINRRELKLLLLGTGESGKSTFIKQMRILHGQGYSESDRKDFCRLVYLNIFTAMQSLIQAMETLNIHYSTEENKHLANLISDVEVNTILVLDKQYTKAIKDLWADDGIKKCYDRRNEFHLLDSAAYLFTELDRIAADRYVPTEQDVLRVRVPTTGINEYSFTVEGMHLRIVDVGGQKSERKKWIHCFENVTSLIFLASLSEYDQRLEETSTENRMKESIALFHTILDCKWFNNTSIILFLNKTDILEEKVKTSNVANYFPEFRGPAKNAKAAMDFISELYEKVYRRVSDKKKTMNENETKRLLFRHFTCATETENINKVFRNVKNTVLVKHLQDIEIL